MKRRRVKITGIGPVTPAGIGREEFWKGILEPVSRVGRLKRFSDDGGAFIGAEVRDFRLETYAFDMSSKRMPRHTQFAVAGTLLALADAGLALADLKGSVPLVIMGASLMDFAPVNRMSEDLKRKGNFVSTPSTIFTMSVSSICGTVGEMIGGTTRTLALQSACCAGIDAIGHAAEMIASGEADIAICGGTEAPLYYHPMLELKLAGLAPGNPDNPERQCRPFDLWRTTGVIGEGSCILILETEGSPRGGYAFVDGYAFASDPVGRTGEGLCEAIEVAMANASINASNVDCINAWGPGHKIVDAAEAASLRTTIGSRLNSVGAVSIKGAIGNPLGAAGAIQVGCAALSLSDGVLPPTVNWEFPDPSCPLGLSNRARFISHGTTLVNAHGLSGSNSCLVLSK
jgi:3-oxoacyl-[acyl-carrier-protein] synthase II